MSTISFDQYLNIRRYLIITALIGIVLSGATGYISYADVNKNYTNHIHDTTGLFSDHDAVMNYTIELDSISFDEKKWGEKNKIRLNLDLYFSYMGLINCDDNPEIEQREDCKEELKYVYLSSYDFDANITILTNNDEKITIEGFPSYEEVLIDTQPFDSVILLVDINATKTQISRYENLQATFEIWVGNNKTMQDPYWKPNIWMKDVAIGLLAFSVMIIISIPVLSYIYKQSIEE